MAGKENHLIDCRMFSLSEIKDAFYNQFNQPGNHYFRYIGERGVDDRTNDVWREFKRKLDMGSVESNIVHKTHPSEWR